MGDAGCAICLEALGGAHAWSASGRPARVVCEHGPEMHEACLARWLVSNPSAGCPLCRAPGCRRVAGRSYSAWKLRVLAVVRLILIFGERVVGGVARGSAALAERLTAQRRAIERLPTWGGRPTHSVTPDELAGDQYSLTGLRALARAAGVEAELGLRRRPGERLSRRDDYLRVLRRVLAGEW